MKTLLALCALLALPVLADSVIVDEYDEFTDERQLYVAVVSYRDDQLATNADSILFKCHAGKPAVGIKSGDFSFHLGSTVEVKLRFDDNPYESTTYQYSNGTALKLDGRRMLTYAIASDRLIAKVGKSDTLRFDLRSARSDLREFHTRCAAWNNPDHGRLLSQPGEDESDEPIDITPGRHQTR